MQGWKNPRLMNQTRNTTNWTKPTKGDERNEIETKVKPVEGDRVRQSKQITEKQAIKVNEKMIIEQIGIITEKQTKELKSDAK